MSTIDPKVDDHSEDVGETEDVASPSMSAEARKKALANKKKREKAKLKKQAQKEGGEHKDDVDVLAQGFQDLSMHQFFTNNTKLAYTRSKGRHVIATQPITAGTPIFEIAPYAGVVLDHVIDQYCHRCYQTASVLYMCKECKHARFCSTTCMNAFSTIHLLECNTLGRLAELEMSGESAPLRMIVRMLYLHHQEQKYMDKNARRKAENKGNIWTAKPGLSFEDAISLVSHQDEFDQQTKLSIMLIVSRLEKLVDASVWQGTDIATKLLLQVQCNAHHITDPNKRRIGLGLYVPAAYLNHSCRPTCVYHFVNGNIVMTAISDVKEGEELTYSYIDLYQPKRVRDQRLAETYFIKNCDCARCQEPPSTSFDRFLGGYHCPSCTTGELISTSEIYTCSSCHHTVKQHVIEDVEKEAKLIFDSALQMLNVGDCKEAEDQLETKLVQGYPSQYLDRFHTLLFNSYLLLIGSSRALQEYDKQLTYCQLVIDGLNGCSLHNHPEMSDAYMSQGQATQALAHSAERKYQRKKKDMGDATTTTTTTTTTDTDSTTPSTSSTDTLDSLRDRYIDLLRQCIQSYERALCIRAICFGRKHTWTRETHNVLQDVTSELEKLTSSGNSQKKKQAKKKK